MSDVRATTALTETLADIATYYAGSAQAPRVEVSQTKTAHTSKPPLPVTVLSLRRETVTLLTSWAVVVVEGRNLHPTVNCRRPRPGVTVTRNRWATIHRCGCRKDPGRPLLDGRKHQLAAGDVPGLTSLLAAHAAWLTDTAGLDPLRELGAVATALEQLVKQSRPRRVRVGPCPEVGEDGQSCGGHLVTTMSASAALLPAVIRCTTSLAHTWTPHEWHALGRRVTPFNTAGMRRFVDALEDRRTRNLSQPRAWGVVPRRRVDLVKHPT